MFYFCFNSLSLVSTPVNPDVQTSSQPDTAEGIRVCTQAERLAHLKRKCADLRHQAVKLLLSPPVDWLYVDDVHKLLYCVVSKAGCTMMKTVLAKANMAALGSNLTLPAQEMEIHWHKYADGLKLFWMNRFNKTAARKRLESYYKFLVVRHPFSRLVSVWRDKVLNIRQSEYKTWPRDILRRYRPWIFNTTRSGGATVHLDQLKPTFPEFLQWIAETKKQNQHWMPVETVCHVCGQSWNAVLRTETMDTDQGILLDQLGEDYNASQFPRIHAFGRKTAAHATSHETLSAFSDVRKGVTAGFLLKYRQDMELFGYHWDPKTKTASCAIQTDRGICC